MDEPKAMAGNLENLLAQGFMAFKIGWGAYGRVDDKHDELLVKTARKTIGDKAFLAVDAGASDAYWRNGLRWAINTSHMLANYQVGWLE
jgi:L-alanine-DL-glutamate epimerase-like enolase superfamily enzyme